MMDYAVEGEELDPADLEDGTWVTPKTTRGGLDPLDLQHKYRKAASQPSDTMPERASNQTLPRASNAPAAASTSEAHAEAAKRTLQNCNETETPDQPV
ncbi:hypothetical protein MTO96_050538 [Rhipicephalus appendiculatus]